MKSRKWLWIGFGALCGLAVWVGWLARPEDELAGMMRLHPGDKPFRGGFFSRNDVATEYDFRASTASVLAALPGSKRATGRQSLVLMVPPLMSFTYEVRLPSGNVAMVADCSGSNTFEGTTCIAIVFASDRPWYERAWSTIKCRLGL